MTAIAVAAAVWMARPAPAEVSVAVASVEPISGDFTAEGVVKGKEFPLSSDIPGRVEWIGVREGDSVEAGQLLMRIEDAEFLAAMAQSRAASRTAAAQLQEARAALALSAADVEARIRVAGAGVRAAQANLSLVRAGARPEHLDQAAQQVAKAEALAREAEKGLQRAEFLFKEGAIAGVALESARTRHETAVADLQQAIASRRLTQAGPRAEEVSASMAAVKAAEEELARATEGRREVAVRKATVRAAAGRLAEARAASALSATYLKRGEVRSPTSGIVSRVEVERGGAASPALPSITVSTRSDLRIEAEVSAEDISKVSIGMGVDVTSPSRPGRTYAGRVVSISPAGELKRDASLRTRIVRVRIELADGWRDLLPGTEVDVEGRAIVKKALSVPSDAVLYDQEGSFVWVVRAGRAARRAVETGYATAQRTEIVAGLQRGDAVIVRGKDSLSERAEVRVAP